MYQVLLLFSISLLSLNCILVDVRFCGEESLEDVKKGNNKGVIAHSSFGRKICAGKRTVVQNQTIVSLRPENFLCTCLPVNASLAWRLRVANLAFLNRSEALVWGLAFHYEIEMNGKQRYKNNHLVTFKVSRQNFWQNIFAAVKYINAFSL